MLLLIKSGGFPVLGGFLPSFLKPKKRKKDKKQKLFASWDDSEPLVLDSDLRTKLFNLEQSAKTSAEKSAKQLEEKMRQEEDEVISILDWLWMN